MPSQSADDAVTLSFPDLSLAEASQLAREFEQELLKAGAAREDVQVAKASTDTQDLGTLLIVGAGLLPAERLKELGWEVVKGAAHKLAGRAVEPIFDYLLRKWGTRAVLTPSSGAAVTIGDQHTRLKGSRTESDGTSLSDIKTLGLVLLGASEFPEMPKDLKLDNPAFRRSADLAAQIFSPSFTVFRDVAVLDLFDRDLRTDDIVDELERFAAAQPDMRDVLIYYVGHGTFGSDREKTYYLLLRPSKPGREPMTALSPKAFRYMLEQNGSLLDRRFYFILDSCFSGSAVDAFQFSSVDPLVEAQVQELLPERGWAVLTASDRNLPAIGQDGAGATMFTGALADVLRGAATPPGTRLTLAELCNETARYIKMKHRLNAVLPQCHAPQQTLGNVALIPLFLPALEGTKSELPRELSEAPLPEMVKAFAPSTLSSNHPFSSAPIPAAPLLPDDDRVARRRPYREPRTRLRRACLPVQEGLFLKPRPGSTIPIQCAAQRGSRNSTKVIAVSCSKSGTTFIVWQERKGVECFRIQLENRALVVAAALSADGDTVAVVEAPYLENPRYRLRLWSIKSSILFTVKSRQIGEPIAIEVPKHAVHPIGIRFNRSGREGKGVEVFFSPQPRDPYLSATDSRKPSRLDEREDAALIDLANGNHEFYGSEFFRTPLFKDVPINPLNGIAVLDGINEPLGELYAFEGNNWAYIKSDGLHYAGSPDADQYLALSGEATVLPVDDEYRKRYFLAGILRFSNGTA